MELADNIKLEIIVSGIQVDELQEELGRHCRNMGATVKFEIHTLKPRFRSIEPAVMGAIVAASGTALGSLITGLLAFAKQREAKKIAIRCKDTSIEVPTNFLDSDKIDQMLDLLEKIKKMDHPQVLF